MHENDINKNADGSRPHKGPLKGLEWALLFAAQHGNIPLVESLLEAGADLETGGKVALEVAAALGYTELVTTLLEAGVRPVDDASKFATWRAAAANGHKATVKVLIDWSDRPRPSSNSGTPRLQP